MKLDLHYTDPRLVALYERDNSRGADTDFYLQLATDIEAHKVLDLGCGTGLLTRALAAQGHEARSSASILRLRCWPTRGDKPVLNW